MANELGEGSPARHWTIGIWRMYGRLLIGLGFVLAGAVALTVVMPRWIASVHEEQMREVAANIKAQEAVPPKTDKQLLDKGEGDLSSPATLDNANDFVSAHSAFTELLSHYPNSPLATQARHDDGIASRINERLSAAARLMTLVNTGDFTGFDAGLKASATKLGPNNIHELQAFADSVRNLPNLMPRDVGGLDGLIRYYSTDLQEVDHVTVTAFLDPSGEWLCSFLLPGKDRCAGNTLTVAPGELDAEQRQRLHDLRGQEGCFVVIQGGFNAPSQLVITEVIGSNCQSLRDRYIHQPKVDGRSPQGS